MTAEQESDLFKTLGRIEAKLDSFDSTLLAHTENDTVNFNKMEADLEILKQAKAHAAGVAEEAAKHASTAGGKMGAFVGGIISVIVTSIAAYLGK